MDRRSLASDHHPGDPQVIRRICLTLILCGASAAHAQFLKPGDNLVIDGVPPIPEELVARLVPYTEFRPAAMVAWHPAKPGMLVRLRAGNTNQLHYVASPGAKPEQWTDFPDAVNSASFQPKKGEFLLFEKGAGGNEVFRIYRMDLATRAVTPVSPDGVRANFNGWNRQGDRILYTTTTIDRNTASRQPQVKLFMADPLKPEDARLLATFNSGGWSGFRFSRDGKVLVFSEYISANEAHVWTLDVETGARRRITPARREGEAPAYVGQARFSRDGQSLFAISDRDNEYRQLVRIDLATGKETPLAPHLKYDVDGFSVSERAGRIGLVTNENGSSVLRFLDFTTFKELPRPALIPGEISGARWRGGEDDEEGDGKEFAVNIASSRSPGDVYSYNVSTLKLTRWTNSASPGLNPLEFAEPRLIKWKSFDGLEISGFLYQPDAKKFPGKRPLLINIHGGPEGQSRPGFINRNNYLVSELGIAIAYPNVRGSSGFGKTFLALDNGMKREDSVKDIGALLDWVKEQPDLDAGRVMVAGGSYGGYMSLAVSTHYADRIAGAIDVVGISNFITFLTNTETYRRDLRRVEYGDERDPAMRAHFEKISPLNNASKIKKPLFVVQGRNDPRVPYTEAEQIVAQLKRQNTPVWFLMAYDEGHGFAKKSNADYQFYATILFMRETLLK
ncbi:MAG: S9 family peptidase [Betaproteobacteria bacterium]|nr:S9 family peptidase [Betaproteobacteria bacterium]